MPPPPPPPRPDEKVVVPDRMRPWTKPGIRVLRIVGTRSGTKLGDGGQDEQNIHPSNTDEYGNYAPSA